MGGAIDAVLFDLDDTLCEYPRTLQSVLDEAFERAGVDPFFDAADFRAAALEVEAESALDLRVQCFERIAAERGRDPAVARQVAEAFEEPDPTDVRFRAGAREALDALEREYRLGLVTNGSRETQWAKLEALGIADRFEVTVFCRPEIGIKPDPAPFRRALEELRVDAARTAYVGNSLDSDVRGANDVGMRSVWVADETPPSDGPRPDYAVPSLGDLAPPPWA